jgi:hypothetical protein
VAYSLTMKTETQLSFQTSINLDQTVRHHMPEDVAV